MNRSTSSARLPALAQPDMSPSLAAELSELFRVFSNDTRLRMLDALVHSGELSVNELSERVGLAPQAISNQLQRMLVRGIVSSRRQANQIFYRILDPCVPRLLELGTCLLDEGRKGRS